MEVRRRIGYPRSYFHVMNRGARKVSIYADEEDRAIFRSLLGHYAEKHSVKLLAWCLMPNHYHLQPDCEGTPLSLMMRDLDRSYARSFNGRHGTTGCLFQGPFKSMVIRDLEGLAYVNRYIHMNPVDIGQSPASYRWSSCSLYLGASDVPSWIDLGPVSQAVRLPDLSDPESYAHYLQAGLVKRKKKRRAADPVKDFYTEWIRHLEERCIERLQGEKALALLSISSLVTWVAHRIHEVPAAAIASYYGLGSEAAVRVACVRFQERLDEDPSLRQALERANVLTTFDL